MKAIIPHHSNCIHYQVTADPEIIFKAKRLCHDVYLRMKYIDQAFSDQVIPNEFEDSSIYLVALNANQQVAGTLRMILGPDYPTLMEWKYELFPSCDPLMKMVSNSNSFEIGALAVGKEYSSLKISWGLYRAAYEFAVSMNLDYAIISMDVRALRSMEMLGWEVIRIGPPKIYYGSLTAPGIMRVRTQSAAVASKNLAYSRYLAAS